MRGTTTSRLIAAATVLAAGISLASCAVESSVPQPDNTRPPVAPVDTAQITATSLELRQEVGYLVQLKFVKDNKYNWIENQKNERAAKYNTIIVGRGTYDTWSQGQTISTSGYLAGAIRGEWSEYKIIVQQKWTDTAYSYLDRQNQVHELRPQDYTAALAAVRAQPGRSISVEQLNGATTYLLDRPLTRDQIKHAAPLTRYFITIEVSNETYTADPAKRLANALSKQQIKLEVPQSVYNQTGEAWEADIRAQSVIWKQHLSRLHGKIIKRETQPDPAFAEVTTTAGRVMVLPRANVPS